MSDVVISGATTLEMHAASMPVGQIPITLTDFSSAGVIPHSDLSYYSSPYFTVANGDVVTISASTCSIGGQLMKDDGSGITWYYATEYKEIIIEAGGHPHTNWEAISPFKPAR